MAAQAVSAGLDRGFIVNAVTADTIRLAPPYILTAEQVDLFLAALPGILDTATAQERR